MKYLLILLLACAPVFACNAHGLLHLTEPPTTVYCGGNTGWAVTYAIAWNLLVVSNHETHRTWDFPLYDDVTYHDEAYLEGYTDGVSFTLKTGKRDKNWIEATLVGSQ